MSPRSRLGRDPMADLEEAIPNEVALDSLDPSPWQFRDPEDLSRRALTQLVQSIRQEGLIQPIVVRGKPDGRNEIIAGHRRVEAARRAGLTRIPVVRRDANDDEAFRVAFLENADRRDVSPLGRARMFKAWLQAQDKRTQSELARLIGRTRQYVWQQLKLLDLPDDVQELLSIAVDSDDPDADTNGLSEHHARQLMRLTDPPEQSKMARRIVDQKLSVGRARELVDGILMAERMREKAAQGEGETAVVEEGDAAERTLGLIQRFRKAIRRPLGRVAEGDSELERLWVRLQGVLSDVEKRISGKGKW